MATTLRNFLLITLISAVLSASEIDRKILAIYDSNLTETDYSNPIHNRFEVILNHYGYYCDYMDAQNLPQENSYKTILIWLTSDKVKDPIGFLKWLITQKNSGKKIIWVGALPRYSYEKDFLKETNELLLEFGFTRGDGYSKNIDDIKVVKKPPRYGFEKRLSPFYTGEFNGYKVVDKNIKEILTLQLKDQNITSPHIFKASWGLYAQEDKLLFRDFATNTYRWIMDPFWLVGEILETHYPVPDTTTKDGKRVAYIHLDGDGALSYSEVERGQINPMVFYNRFATKYPFKTGVSFIASEVDERYFGTKETIESAKKLYALPHIEPASHTYSHPLSWSKALSAYSLTATTKGDDYYFHGSVKAFKSESGEINSELEIKQSVDFLSTLRDKKVDVLYWSGNCLPTKKDLEIAKKYGISAINGGDSYFDMEHPSYAYLYPLGRYVDGERQIYSTGSNENLYTNLWSERFWGFKGVTQTFKNTGEPKRIKPINLYFHFYSLEKIASEKALREIYEYLDSQKESLAFLYPSEFIKIAQNFYTVSIKKDGSKYTIDGATWLKEFRIDGKIELISKENIKAVHYDKKQNVTYITLGE